MKKTDVFVKKSVTNKDTQSSARSVIHSAQVGHEKDVFLFCFELFLWWQSFDKWWNL